MLPGSAESANKMALPRNIIVIGLFENKTLNLNVDAPVRVSEVKEYFAQRKVRPTGRGDGRAKISRSM